MSSTPFELRKGGIAGVDEAGAQRRTVGRSPTRAALIELAGIGGIVGAVAVTVAALVAPAVSKLDPVGPPSPVTGPREQHEAAIDVEVRPRPRPLALPLLSASDPPGSEPAQDAPTVDRPPAVLVHSVAPGSASAAAGVPVPAPAVVAEAPPQPTVLEPPLPVLPEPPERLEPTFVALPEVPSPVSPGRRADADADRVRRPRWREAAAQVQRTAATADMPGRDGSQRRPEGSRRPCDTSWEPSNGRTASRTPGRTPPHPSRGSSPSC